MYKENNKLNIDLLSSINTELPNGVEVKISIDENKITDFRRAIVTQLCYFENIYFQVDNLDDYGIKDVAESFNSLTIKKYKNFSVNTERNKSEISLLLGKVRYPVRLNGLNKTYDVKINDFPIALNFEIGELSITPNREEIIYNTATISKIEEKLDAAIEEIKELIQDDVIDTDSLFEYVDNISKKHYTVLLEDLNSPVKIETTFLKDLSFTLNGKSYPKKVFKEVYEWFGYSVKIESHFKYSGSITGVKNTFEIERFIKSPSKFRFCHIPSLNGITKDFIRRTFPSPIYFVRVDNINLKKRYSSTIKSLKDYITWRGYSDSDVEKVFSVIFRGYLKLLKDTFKDSSYYVNNQSPTKQFLQERKDKLASRRIPKVKGKDKFVGELTIYKLRKSEKYGGGYKGLIEDSVSINIDSKLNHKLFIYTTKEKHDAIYNLFELMNRTKNVCFCRINERKEKFIAENKHFIHVNNIFKMKHKHLKDYITAQYILKNLPQIGNSRIKELFKDVSIGTYNDITILCDYVSKFRGDVSSKEFQKSFYDYGIEHNLFNLEMKAKFEILFPKLKKIAFFTDVFSTYSLSNSQRYLFTDYLLSRKVLRPDLKAVKEAKSFIENYTITKN